MQRRGDAWNKRVALLCPENQPLLSGQRWRWGSPACCGKMLRERSCIQGPVGHERMAANSSENSPILLQALCAEGLTSLEPLSGGDFERRWLRRVAQRS